MLLYVYSPGELLSVSHGTTYTRNPSRTTEGGSQGGEQIFGSFRGFALRGWSVADLLIVPYFPLHILCFPFSDSLSWLRWRSGLPVGSPDGLLFISPLGKLCTCDFLFSVLVAKLRTVSCLRSQFDEADTALPIFYCLFSEQSRSVFEGPKNN